MILISFLSPFLFPSFVLFFSFSLSFLFYSLSLSFSIVRSYLTHICVLNAGLSLSQLRQQASYLSREKFWHKELKIVLFSSRVYSTPLISTFSSLPISSLLSYPLLLSSFPSDDIVIPYIFCLALVRQQTSNASRIENSLHALQTMIYSKANSCQSS